jgi:hypothetical protein
MHPAGLAGTQLIAVECLEQVAAGVHHAPRVAWPLANRVLQAITGRSGISHQLSGRYRLSITDDNLGHSARVMRDRGAVGHNAQRRLHAIQTLSQLSYSPTRFVLFQSCFLSGERV